MPAKKLLFLLTVLCGLMSTRLHAQILPSPQVTSTSDNAPCSGASVRLKQSNIA